MTILVTGGSGYTASALSRLLNDSNHPFIVASRSGQVQGAYPAVTLDFRKPETYNNPFKMDRNIDRIYVVPPQGHSDTMPDLGNFIDFAVSKGVKRIVLLSSSPFDAEHVTMGIAHRHLLTTGIDFTVLRPTWFMQNLKTNWITSIKEQDQIMSATEDGRIPMVSTDDVAQAAFEALTDEKRSLNKEVFVFGPELHTFDDAAKILSFALGREISHKRVSVEEMAQIIAQFGVDPEFAIILGEIEGRVAHGSEESLFVSGDLTKFIGKHTLSDYVQQNKDLWTGRLPRAGAVTGA